MAYLCSFSQQLLKGMMTTFVKFKINGNGLVKHFLYHILALVLFIQAYHKNVSMWQNQDFIVSFTFMALT